MGVSHSHEADSTRVISFEKYYLHGWSGLLSCPWLWTVIVVWVVVDGFELFFITPGTTSKVVQTVCELCGKHSPELVNTHRLCVCMQVVLARVASG